MPSDAQFYEVATDVVDTQVYTPQLGMTRADAAVVASQTTAHEVIYSRILTYTPPTKAGAAKAPEAIEFSVIGPGAKLKVFVDPNAPALSSMNGTTPGVIGGVGGWRQLASPATSQPSTVETVPILTYSQINSLFASLEPIVALSYVPLPYTSRRSPPIPSGIMKAPSAQARLNSSRRMCWMCATTWQVARRSRLQPTFRRIHSIWLRWRRSRPPHSCPPVRGLDSKSSSPRPMRRCRCRARAMTHR